jgi:uncharacterized protein YecE (DUF72 family)
MILVGTSGFSYDDWDGIFYPSGTPPGRRLNFYATKFKTTEINSTFYRIPSPSTMSSMARRTPHDFEFSVKLYGGITHSREEGAEEKFREAIKPLLDSGKLGCILAQFPWSFKRTEENISLILRIKDAFHDIPLVVEFRNREWIKEETFEFLERNEMGFCCVDEPPLPGLIPPVAKATSKIGYVRFHGRNREKWWKHEEAWERYDYLYSEEELRGWIPKIKDIDSKAEKTYVFFNNHRNAKGAINAQMLIEMIGEMQV